MVNAGLRFCVSWATKWQGHVTYVLLSVLRAKIIVSRVEYFQFIEMLSLS